MFSFHPKPERRTSFEDVFFDHYERLMEWALQLTRQDRFEAEDLVQELYVRFARLGAIPERIEDAESYLFAVLRNLHYTRAKRTRGADGLSIVDYDSVEHGLRAIDRSELLSVRSDLYGICNYLCGRKETSRSASIFILRYFLGYFPNEIAKVAQSSRVAVDKAIQAIRREARLNMERPGTLRSIADRRGMKPRSPYSPENEPPLFMSLREKIFASCTGECFGYAPLKAKYEQDATSLTTEELSHLVSCPSCLDHANRILGLPLLEDRSPDDTIGRDTPQGPNASATAAPLLVSSRLSRKKNDMERRRTRLKRCVEEADQHRPQRLLLLVDGEVRASQKVTAPLNELRVELGRTEEPSFIEVLSEQGYCLAFFPVYRPEPGSDLSQTQDTSLSDDRSLKLVVSFLEETPSIQVVYLDPLVAAEAEMAEKHGDALKATARTQPIAFEEEEVFAWPARLWSRFTGALSLNMNPFLVSATLFGLCSIVCLVMWTRSGPRISPHTFLSRAQQSDASAVATVGNGVIYQKVRISMPGHAMERAIYRDPQKKRKPRHQHLNPSDEQLRERLDVAGVKWNDPLSAANYAAWREGLSVKQDAVTRTGNNLLTLTTSTQSDSPVLKESLTVRASDFHPVERTIELRDEGTVQIAELNYDVMPWAAVNQDWFEPLAGDITGAADIHPALHLPRVLSDLELDQAELGARLTLNRLHADQGEQIHFSRSSSGVEVKGVVDTEQRKKQLVSQLLLVPHVRPSLLSVEELGNNPLPAPSRPSEPIHAYSVESQSSPLEEYMRARNLPTDNLAAVSQSLLDNALTVQRAQGHLAELQSRFKEGTQLSGDLQAQFAKLSESYAGAMQSGLDSGNKVLLSLGLDTGTRPFPAASPSAADEDLAQQVRRYQALCQELIASGTTKPRSAQAIANDLVTAGAQIRMRIPHLPPASGSTARN